MADKYNAEQLKALGEKGEAFKGPDGTYSYPIADAEDLGNAIHAVGRGNADHDALRKYIIGRAKALGLSEQIPDTWNADGSLADEEKAAVWDAHRRAGQATYGDLYDALDSAVAAKYNDDKESWSWIRDFTDSWVVFELNGETFQSPYTTGTDGTIEIGKKVPVRATTTYAPVEQNSARDKPTPQDGDIATALAQAKITLAKAKAIQLTDPDNATDPDDADVMAKITAAEAAVEAALAAQAKDGNEDPKKPEKKSANTVPAAPRRVFGAGDSLRERPNPIYKVEIRMDDADGSTANFVGYASTTGVGYSVHDWLGEYRETIHPGAFAKTLREQGNVPLLFNHDGYPFASTGSGTSRLSEDAQGLRNEAVLDRTDGNTNTVCVQMRRGVLDKMSFSFRAVKDTWNDAYDERGVNELALYDTSIVTYPANPSTSAELRSLFVDSLGREGQGVMWSLRSAFADIEHRAIPDEADPLLEQAIRALSHGDQMLCRRADGPHHRARTFLVAGLFEEVRKGAVLSAKNRALLQTAADALSGGQKAHDTARAAHAAAADAIGQVLDTSVSNDSGLDGDAGGGPNNGGGKNPLNPADGAGPRSIPKSVIAARHELERLKLRSR